MSEEMKARLIRFLDRIKPDYEWEIKEYDTYTAIYNDAVDLLMEIELLKKELTLTPYEIYMQTPFAGEREYD